MDSQTWIRYFEAAPEPVRDYLLDMASASAEKRAQQKLAYDNDAWERVMDIAWETIFLGKTRQEFIERVRKIAGDRKPEDVERAILKEVVLPLSDLVVWDVEARLQELGVPMSDIQASERITLRPVSYGAAVRRAATDAHISLFGEEMVRRLRDVYVSAVKGVRTEDQYREILSRPQTEGGMGFTPDQAKAFLAAMEELEEQVKILSEQEYAEWFSAFQSQTQGKSLIQLKDEAPEDDSDEVTASGPMQDSGHVALNEAVRLAMEKIGDLGLDEYLKKRLENLVSTRLRDVRNADQVAQTLSREVKVGGVGLPLEKAELAAKTIEAAYAEHRTAIVEEEKIKIAQTTSDQQMRIEERRKRESEEHAKWYQDKVRSVKGAEEQTQAAFAQMKQAYQAQQSGMPMPEPGPQNVDAVKPPTRLTGLTEEVGGMTLAEFRRLAKSPDDAAAKLWQKFETLQSESFDRYTEGVQAWRQSPLQQLYLKLVAASFAAGKPVAQVVQEKRASDPSMPSTEELAAIIQLNTKIQL